MAAGRPGGHRLGRRPGRGRRVRRAVHQAGRGARRRRGRRRVEVTGKVAAKLDDEPGRGSTSPRPAGGAKVLGQARAVVRLPDRRDAQRCAGVAPRRPDHAAARRPGPRGSSRPATEDELVDAVRAADAAGEPCSSLGGGCNLSSPTTGFDGTVVLVAPAGSPSTRRRLRRRSRSRSRRASRGTTSWRARSTRGWPGIEALSGIPGLAGATPIQNVGAYGQEVAQTIARGARARPADRRGRAARPPPTAASATGPALFKRDPAATSCSRSTLPAPARRPAAPGPLRRAGPDARRRGRASARRPRDVRDAVLELRRGKGMVLDPDDHDTWSAGSFFTNPVLAAPTPPAALPGRRAAAARPATAGSRPSAAWLIEQAGFAKGYGARRRPAVDQAHPRAHQPRRRDRPPTCWRWPREVRAGVRDRFGVDLVPSRSWSAARSCPADPGPCRSAGRQPASMPASSRRLRRRPGAREPRDRAAGQLGQLARRRQPVHVARQLVLGGQPRAEQQRVVGAERHRHPGRRSSARSGTSAGVGVDARARRSRPGRPRRVTPALGEPRRARAGSSAARTPCPTRSAPSASRQAAHARPGPSSSPPCGTRGQAGPSGDPEGRREVLGPARAARRWPARSRPPRGRRTAPPAGPGCGRPAGAGSGWPRRPRRCPTPVRRAGVARRRPAPARGRGQPAEPGGVRRRVDLDLQPAASRRRRSSSAASRTSRRTSASSRTHDRATS